MNAEQLFAQTQILNASAALHRAQVRNEKAEERARRQQHRAEAIAQQLGSTRPGVVKAMLALVQADEHINPKGDPPDPVAPGARAVHKPTKQGVQKRTPVTADQPEQMGFWE